MAYMEPREDLVRHHRWLRQYGLNDSHSGNASVRVGDSVWITPSGCCADTLEPEDLIACRVDGGSGQGQPSDGASLDATLHLAIYRSLPTAGAVLHSHGPATIALTLGGERFRPMDFEGRYYFPDGVEIVDAGYDGYLEHAPRLVSEALTRGSICVYRGHGVYAVGETIDRAYKWTCSLEHSAKIAALMR
jgi:L-fuculose-phosphate aldolase